MEYKSGSSDGLPKDVRPEAYIDGLDPTPTEWVTVLHHALDRRDVGIGSYLTTHAGSELALSKASWTHGEVGEAGIAEYGDGRVVFQDGMADRTRRAEFFVQRRRHQQPQVEPTIEFTPSFLWYFSAVPRPDGSWYFLDEAGRDQERDHWRSCNVPPSGGIDETRLRRDILGQWAEGPPDPLQELAAARSRFSTEFTRLLGQPVYRAWDGADHIAFTGLHMPTSKEQHEADAQILILAKGVIDYLDVKAVRKLPGADPKGTTLNCLDAWTKSTGADPDTLIGPLRLLQGLRSAGPAHPRTRDWNATLVRAGLDELGPDEQFVELVRRTGTALDALSAHAASQTAE